MEDKFSHLEKQDAYNTSTLDGIRIDNKDEQPLKAHISIRISLESDSNVTRDKLLQKKKQHSPITSTLDGIQIDDKEKQ
jgi:hypothetical protein